LHLPAFKAQSSTVGGRISLTLRLALLSSLFIGLVYAGYLAEADIPKLEAWIVGLGNVAPFAFIVVFAVLALFFVPESVLCAMAGVLFGLGEGTILAVAGGIASSWIAFLVSRWFLRHRIESWLENNTKLRAVERAASKGGTKLVSLLRLTPLNQTLISYLLGGSGISFARYAPASLAMTPGHFVAVYFGYVAKHMTRVATESSTVFSADHVLMIVGLATAVGVFAWVTRIAKRAFDEAASE
jgi:uncharacterized membrane protein YdjX (TVP38/TMEM64 family)